MKESHAASSNSDTESLNHDTPPPEGECEALKSEDLMPSLQHFTSSSSSSSVHTSGSRSSSSGQPLAPATISSLASPVPYCEKEESPELDDTCWKEMEKTEVYFYLSIYL
jgi:hypothetical protein